MKNNRLRILVLVCLTLPLFISCDEVTKDKNGILLFENLKSESKKSPMLFKGEEYTGPIVKYYRDGTLEFKGSYNDGNKHGPWKYYHPDGKLKREETAQPSQGKHEVKTYRSTSGILYTELIGMHDDTIHYKKYHHNGILGQELTNFKVRVFRKWSTFGNLYHYYNEDSISYIMNIKTKEITHKGFFENGKRTGFWFKYYRNGNKQYERNYKSGKLVGKCIEYFSNGKIDLESNYNSNGYLEGVRNQYHKNGSLFSTGQYDNKGRKKGTWYYYTIEGKLKSIKNYRLNSLNGHYEDHYPNGNRKEKGNYRNNRKVGTWYYYDEYGKLLREVNESNNLQRA
ncbi:MAG: hypothetical protein JXR05_15085 [Flavobacteriaceae bacterium]